MQQWLTMTGALIPAFGIILVGVVARRINWLTEEADRTLLNLCVRLLFPCFILIQMNRSEWPTGASGLLIPPLVGFGLTAMGFAVCWMIVRPFGKQLGLPTSVHRRTFVLCAGMFNYGYLPIPLVQQLFPKGSPVLPTLLLHNVGVEVAMWTLGILILAGKLTKRWWAGILNPVVLTIMAAITLKLTGAWQLFDANARPVVSLIDSIGQCAIPLSLLLSGATISDVWREASFKEGWGVLGSSTLIRLGVLPAMFLGVAMIFPFSAPLENVIAIQAAMPAAVFPILLAKHYGGDTPTAVRVVLITHFICLITAPAWLAFGLPGN